MCACVGAVVPGARGPRSAGDTPRGPGVEPYSAANGRWRMGLDGEQSPFGGGRTRGGGGGLHVVGGPHRIARHSAPSPAAARRRTHSAGGGGGWRRGRTAVGWSTTASCVPGKAVLNNPHFFFSLRTAPRDHQPSTANRHQPPPVVHFCFCGLASCPCLEHEAESVPVNVRFCRRCEPFSFSFSGTTAPVPDLRAERPCGAAGGRREGGAVPQRLWPVCHDPGPPAAGALGRGGGGGIGARPFGRKETMGHNEGPEGADRVLLNNSASPEGGGVGHPHPPPPHPLLSDWANFAAGLRPIEKNFWRLRRKSV